MINTLQKQLRKIYGLSHIQHVSQFLINFETLKNTMQQDELDPNIREKVVLRINPDDSVELGLYIKKDSLHNLRINEPDLALGEHNLADFCSVIEGVSHVQFLLHRSKLALELSALEMEVQAEIDKFITSFIYRYSREGSTHCAQELQEILFQNFHLNPQLKPEEKDRYQLASHAAAKLCRHLRREFIKGKPKWAELLSFLRQFYRQSWRAKHATISTAAT